MLGGNCSPCCGFPPLCLAACGAPESFTLSVTASDYTLRMLGIIRSSLSPAYLVGTAVGFSHYWNGDAVAGTHEVPRVAEHKYELRFPNFLAIFYIDRCKLSFSFGGCWETSIPGDVFVNGIAQPTYPKLPAEINCENLVSVYHGDYGRGDEYAYGCESIANVGEVDVLPLSGDPNYYQGLGMGHLTGPTFSVSAQVPRKPWWEGIVIGGKPPPEQPNPGFPGHEFAVTSNQDLYPSVSVVEESGSRDVVISITPNYLP